MSRACRSASLPSDPALSWPLLIRSQFRSKESEGTRRHPKPALILRCSEHTGLTALPSIVSRAIAPLEAAVVSVTSIHAGGDAVNIIRRHSESRNQLSGTHMRRGNQDGSAASIRMRELRRARDVGRA